MSLPFNSYDQLRFRGNEFVTDQVLNRAIYRLYRNDVYLDDLLNTHIENDLIHNMGLDEGNESFLTGDKLVLLICTKRDTAYSADGVTIAQRGWQALIDSQPKNLGGCTLVFRFQPTDRASRTLNNHLFMHVTETLRFEGFYGGTLIVEGPECYSNVITSVYNNDQTSDDGIGKGITGISTVQDDGEAGIGQTAANLKFTLTTTYENTALFTEKINGENRPVVEATKVLPQQYCGTDGAVMMFNKCRCHVQLRNIRFVQNGIPFEVGNSDGMTTSKRYRYITSSARDYDSYRNEDNAAEIQDFSGRLISIMRGNWYPPNKNDYLTSIEGLKRFINGQIFDMNIISALRFTDCSDVLISNCHIIN